MSFLGNLFGGGQQSIPQPRPTPPLPAPNDKTLMQAKQAAEAEMVSSSGRNSTMLSPQGTADKLGSS